MIMHLVLPQTKAQDLMVGQMMFLMIIYGIRFYLILHTTVFKVYMMVVVVMILKEYLQ